MPDFWVFRPISLAIIPFLVYSITMINTKNVKKDLLRFKHDDMDGQDYETAANLIGGNQFIAAANFIDMLDTMPREHMITLIYRIKNYGTKCGILIIMVISVLEKPYVLHSNLERLHNE